MGDTISRESSNGVQKSVDIRRSFHAVLDSCKLTVYLHKHRSHVDARSALLRCVHVQGSLHFEFENLWRAPGQLAPQTDYESEACPSLLLLVQNCSVCQLHQIIQHSMSKVINSSPLHMIREPATSSWLS